MEAQAVPASDDAAGTTPIGSTSGQPRAMMVWLGTAPNASTERQVLYLVMAVRPGIASSSCTEERVVHGWFMPATMRLTPHPSTA
jgi:hypothetical protein